MWTTHNPAEGESPVCPACAALDGHHDGDGWTSNLPADYNLQYLAVHGTFPALAGPPPLHDHCRCRVT